MTEALLEVRDLKKHFPLKRRGLLGRRPRLQAVDGISFTLGSGESLGLVGESGCGKSTTARTILGLLRATSGSIRFDGHELTKLGRRGWRLYRRRIQMIFQDPYASLDPRQTVGSILKEPLTIHRLGRPRERRLRALALLEAVGMNPRHVNRYPHEFSGGQRQRIAIARALALEPELIVCDEPVSALDVSIQSQILNLLGDLQRRFGLAYLFIAHDLAVVRQLCPRVAVMYLGRIVETAERDRLFEDPQHPYTQALLSAVPVPDPEVEAERERIVLEGDVPSPADPPSGCAFHPRCHVRDEVPGERCSQEMPALAAIEPGLDHLAACHLVTPRQSVEMETGSDSAPIPAPLPARSTPAPVVQRTPAPLRASGSAPRPPAPAPKVEPPGPKRARALTVEELDILQVIQLGYGEAKNGLDQVTFTDHLDAVLFVQSEQGEPVFTANLSTLARWRADGTIGSEEELKRDWLRIENG